MGVEKAPFFVGCRAWTRTKIPSSRGMCPTIRRPGKIDINYTTERDQLKVGEWLFITVFTPYLDFDSILVLSKYRGQNTRQVQKRHRGRAPEEGTFVFRYPKLHQYSEIDHRLLVKRHRTLGRAGRKT